MIYVMEVLYEDIGRIPAGHWVAVDAQTGRYIAHGHELTTVVEAANDCGFDMPMIRREPPALTVHVMFKDRHIVGVHEKHKKETAQ
jgi:hypothetical protein